MDFTVILQNLLRFKPNTTRIKKVRSLFIFNNLTHKTCNILQLDEYLLNDSETLSPQKHP